MTAAELAAAARRGAITLASDPAMRHYSPEALELVYERTVVNLAGAGGWDKATERLAADPALGDVPPEVIGAIVGASLKHLARALTQPAGVAR